jgi:hypothetical protein
MKVKAIITAPFALALGLLGAVAGAQPINPLWLGHWQVARSNLTQPAPRLEITRHGPATEARMDGRVCALAYDGQVQASWIAQQIRERQDAQLDLRNWTGLAQGGADNAQLVGLRREFAQAIEIVEGIPAGSFRRVRFKGTGCPSEDDVFHLLSGTGHSSQHLYRINLPNNSVGVEVTLHTLVP